MPVEVKLPRLGQGMDEGKILRWLKSEGDVVEKGEEIYEVETEKVNVEVESPAAGTVLKIAVSEGDTIPIGTVLAWVGEPGEKVPDAASQNGAVKTADEPLIAAPAAPTPAPAAVRPTSAASGVPAEQRAASSSDRIKASPLARRMAAEQGIDLSALSGSGPDGRIIARDLAGAASTVAATQPSTFVPSVGVERVPFTSMRATIARRLTEAWQAPAFYLTVDVRMEAANDLRKRLVSSIKEGDVRPTISDVISKAAAVALRRVPDMNVCLDGDGVLHYQAVHIGLAVATDAGLVVPVLRNVHANTISEIAAQRKAVVDKARAGKLMPADFEGGTFTISNLGMMGIDEFTAVINPPMAGILAVGRTREVPVVEDRKVVSGLQMTVTLGCDHRAVDGAVGARFLAAFKAHLEDPLLML